MYHVHKDYSVINPYFIKRVTEDPFQKAVFGFYTVLNMHRDDEGKENAVLSFAYEKRGSAGIEPQTEAAMQRFAKTVQDKHNEVLYTEYSPENLPRWTNIKFNSGAIKGSTIDNIIDSFFQEMEKAYSVQLEMKNFNGDADGYIESLCEAIRYKISTIFLRDGEKISCILEEDGGELADELTFIRYKNDWAMEKIYVPYEFEGDKVRLYLSQFLYACTDYYNELVLFLENMSLEVDEDEFGEVYSEIVVDFFNTVEMAFHYPHKHFRENYENIKDNLEKNKDDLRLLNKNNLKISQDKNGELKMTSMFETTDGKKITLVSTNGRTLLKTGKIKIFIREDDSIFNQIDSYLFAKGEENFFQRYETLKNQMVNPIVYSGLVWDLQFKKRG